MFFSGEKFKKNKKKFLLPADQFVFSACYWKHSYFIFFTPKRMQNVKIQIALLIRAFCCPSEHSTVSNNSVDGEQLDVGFPCSYMP